MPKPGGSPSIKWTGTKGDDVANVTSLDALKQTTYDGAAGYDTLNLSGLSSGVSLTVNLNNPGTSRLWAESPFHGSWWDYISQPLAGRVVENTIKNFEKIVGTNSNDYFNFAGGTVARVVDGGGGDDAIYMGSSTGTNTTIGGLGSDQLFGNRNGDLLIGGTYNGGSAPGDNTRDEFVAYSGTILDFELGVDMLYIDAANLPGNTTSASWVNVTTSYGAGARLTIATDRVITVIGVAADEMNAIPNGYVLLANGRTVTSGAGDDFIFDTASTGTVDRYIFPSGSGDDELAGFDVQLDTLVFADTPTFTQVEYHGEAALLATYDGGASSVLLIGLGSADQSNLHVEVLPPDPFI